jgi:hypothetical protein
VISIFPFSALGVLGIIFTSISSLCSCTNLVVLPICH